MIGFTLVEVLIASVIIFVVLSLASVTIINVQNNTQRAAKVTKALSVLPYVMDTVKQQIRDNVSSKVSGEGSLSNVQFRRSAELVKSSAPPPQLIVENSSSINYKPRFFLFKVDLRLAYEGVFRDFVYEEFAWETLSVNTQ